MRALYTSLNAYISKNKNISRLINPNVINKEIEVKIFLFRLFTILFLFSTSAHGLEANDTKADEIKGLGLKPITEKEAAYINDNWYQIIGVRSNKIGALRIQEELKNEGKLLLSQPFAETEQEEFITVKGLAKQLLLQAEPNVSLPRSVDNSKLPSFPPIGDQRQLGSCVAWASTYYQGSHEIGLLNGYNNKTSSNRILSPKWTYSLLNDGANNGLTISEAYQLLAQNGATSIVNLPYDAEYLSWDLNTDHWTAAISNRLTQPKLINIASGPESLDLIKQILNNGHVLTFGTYIYSWVFTTVKDDPASPGSPFAGQKAASWLNGRSGAHHLTIVGYNDDIWIDINGNGVVDPGEKGAFLVANSWGTGWGNNGFIWISYDAFFKNSAVVNGPSQGRVPAGEVYNSNLVSIVPKAANYSPSLIAKFTVKQTLRNQIAVMGGVSDLNAVQPTKTFLNYALNYQGGNYAFNGKTANQPQSATFTLDMTDLLPSTLDVKQRFYLVVTDKTVNNPTTVSDYTLIDFSHNQQVACKQLPLTADGSSIYPSVDYTFSSSAPTTTPTVAITSPTANQTIKENINVAVNATSSKGISRVDFYIDSTLYQSDTSAPYVFAVDTTELSNGAHQFMVMAYDNANQMSSNTVNVTIDNLPSSLYVNAGGESVSWQGKTWQNDQSYTGASSKSSYKLPFANPVYNTVRFGNFTYKLAVTNGPHLVKLKFAETYFKIPSQRVFNVLINGKQVIQNLDLAKEAGFGVPHDQLFEVNVTNNTVTIDFIPTVNNAVISGIEIIKQVELTN